MKEQKNSIGMSLSDNRPTSANSIPNQNDSPSIKQNLKTEIDLLFILAPLPIVLVLWRYCCLSCYQLFHW